MLTGSDVIATLSSRDLECGYERLAEIPHFSQFKDIEKAAMRTATALRNGERVGLCGDYDNDGISAFCLVSEFFEAIGHPLHKAIIPDRFTEGYGITLAALKRLEGCSLVITVDNGISASDEVTRYCHSVEGGIDLIITDHHTVPESGVPEAYAVVNPKQADCGFSFPDICGTAVAWYFCAALKHELGAKVDMRRWMDLLALTAISDVMPLVGVNRLFVKLGLRQINDPARRRPFFDAVMKVLGKNSLSVEDLAFQVVPRQNATGRLESAIYGAEALMAGPEEVEAKLLRTTQINQLRKALQADIMEEAMVQAKEQRDFIVVSGEWHEGVVGIVAQHLSTHFGYPTIVFSTTPRGELKGSGRSVGSLNLYDLVKQHRSLLLGFGGHPGACGLAMKSENLDALRTALQRASRELPRNVFDPLDPPLGELASDEADLDLAYAIEAFSPFGEGNPEPVFTIRGARITRAKAVGSEGNHTRLDIIWHGLESSIMAFNRDVEEFSAGGMIDFDYTLYINIWQGRESLQFKPRGDIVLN